MHEISDTSQKLLLASICLSMSYNDLRSANDAYTAATDQYQAAFAEYKAEQEENDVEN